MPLTVIERSIEGLLEALMIADCRLEETRCFKSAIGNRESAMFSSRPLALRTYLAGGRGRTARCCELRESYRGPNQRPPTRPCRAALLPGIDHADHRNNSARRTH